MSPISNAIKLAAMNVKSQTHKIDGKTYIFKTKLTADEAQKRVAEKKADVKRAEDAESEKPQAKMLKEIKDLVEEMKKMAREGEPRSEVAKVWNGEFTYLLNLYGGEYLPSGAASEMSDEWLDEINELLETNANKKPELKPEPRKVNFGALEDTFQALKKQTETTVKEATEMSKGKTAFTGKAKIINKLATLYTSYNALMTKMRKMPGYDDWRHDNTWEFLSNIPYNMTTMVKEKAGVKEAKDEYSGT